MKNKQKFYNHTWFMWLTLFTIPPIGLFLMWKNKRCKLVPRIILTVIFGGMSLMMFQSFGAQLSGKPEVAINAKINELPDKMDAKNQGKIKEKEAEQELLENATIEERVSDISKELFEDRFMDLTYEDEAKTKLQLNIKMLDSLTKGMIKKQMGYDIEQMIEELCKIDKFYELSEFKIAHETTFVDVYGNKSDGIAQWVSFSTDELKKINWENFSTSNLGNLASDFFRHHYFDE
ncbi:hypothetical protein SH2C18_03430 [Clostridium sediminicola]|uniref:hypothetical protein n=1 Tax=Clostridium sediminicola TaxID=3114879 RepID=UPI0031F27744